MKDQHDKLLFRCMEITLVCAKCRASLNKADLTSCVHNTTEVPPWKRDIGRQNLVRKLLEDDPNMMLREVAGVACSESTFAFSHDAIDLFRKRKHRVQREHITNVFTCIDPNGGGQSAMAICSGYYTKKNHLVVRLFTDSHILLPFCM